MPLTMATLWQNSRMSSKRIPATVISVLASVLVHLMPVASISEGYELGDPSRGISILFPLTVIQCEPAVIFYNITTSDQGLVLLYPDGSLPFLTFTLPTGVGYVVWDCNVPAGSSFIASAARGHIYSVEAGQSEACLGDLSSDTTVALYATSEFQLFTRYKPTSTDTSRFAPATLGTYPTVSFPTVTANPLSVTQSAAAAALLFACTHNRSARSAKIAGATVGGVILVVTFIYAMMFARKREKAVNASLQNDLPPDTA